MKIFGLDITRSKDGAAKVTDRRVSPFAFARGFLAASTGRLFQDWITGKTDINDDLYSNLQKMRTRGRDMAKNNSYFKRWLSMRERNIVGSQGIQLQMKVSNPNGSQDNYANNLIEGRFKDWGKRETCCVDGKRSWLQVQNEYTRLIATDGEVFIHKVKNFPNKYKFALEFIDANRCDTNYTTTMRNGNRVINGIEIDKWGKPIAYYFYTGKTALSNDWGGERIRITADSMIHGFKEEFAGQTRGIPMGSAAMAKIHMLDKMNEAYLVASRAGAAKMGFYQVQQGLDYAPDVVESAQLVQEVEPGKIEILPEGIEFKSYDPTFPANEHASFTKTMLREIAGALGVSYNTLANDLEGVSYSSLRAGSLDERDGWRTEQSEIIGQLMNPVFSDWLDMFLMTPMSGSLPYSKYEKFNQPTWLPRSWPWVDPLKDMQAKILMIENLLESPAKVAAENGWDYDDLMLSIAKAKEIQEQNKLTVSKEKTGAPVQDENDKN